ncbi:hypothetical protein HanPI659440_Chr03g0127871 [Helianthus annuus]|nr:hypothetical protein HanPI659440_Chr03g0127871 [Helianthus annuus]
MDKNKNRTDLLAAGRKKLQQYRQKKDGKGGKSSGKANKPDPDVNTEESSSVAKQTKGKKQSAETNVPVQDSATELVDSSNADITAPDLSSTSDLPTEVSETDVSVNTSVSDENLQSSNLDDAMPADLSLKGVDIEGQPDSDYVSVTPVGFEAVLDNIAVKAGDVKAASGEDQVPDVGAMPEHDHSCSEPDNTVSLIHLEKDDKDQVDSAKVEEDTKMEYTDSAPEQTNQHEDHMAGFRDDGGVKLSDRSGESEFGPVSLTQLAKALQLLSEDELRFVMAGREADNGGDMKSDSVELHEKLKEQLYINNIEKEVTYLQLCEERDVRKEIDYEKLSLSASLRDVEGKNKIFSEELATCKSELDRVTSEMEKLQIELKRSEHELSELVDSKNLLSEFQAKHENLSENVFSLTKENEKLKKELMDCKSLLELSQVENVNTKESLALVMAERAKLEEEKESYVSEYEHFVKENKKFSTELLESQDLVEKLRSEIAKLNENLELAAKEETRLGEEVNQLTGEKEGALKELTNCKSLLELSQAEIANSNEQFVHNSKNFSAELSESQHLVESLHAEIAKLSENLDLVTKEKTRLGEEVNRLTVEIEENKKVSMELLESQDLVESLRLEIAKLNENLELVTKEEARLGEEVNKLTVEKEAALTELTNCKSLLELSQTENANFNEQFVHSSKNFSLELSESQQLVESLRAEIAKLSENLDLVTIEKTRLEEEVNRLTVEKEEKEDLMESLRSEIGKLNENLELVAKEETSLKKEVNQLTVEKEKALTELTDCKSLLELSQSENANFNEQLVHSSKNFSLELSESQHLTESLRAEIAKLNENLDLVTEEKTKLEEEVNRLTVEREEALTELANYKTVMNDLQVKYEKSTADSKLEELSNSLEEIVLKNVILDEYVKQYVFTVEANKGELVILLENLKHEVITTRTKNSELQQQADDMTEKNKDLEESNELASYVIRKVFDNLQKLVDNSGPSTEQSEDNTASEQLDHLEISNYDVFIEKLIMILHERAQLESKNREYNVELLRRLKDMEELNKRCINPDVILKLFENIQRMVTLDNVEFKPDEPLSSLESIIQHLVKNLKFNETKLNDLQNEIDHLTSSIVSYEIESHVLKGSLITAMEQVAVHQSDAQLKETEVSQSEQRVSALREKLHIAVTKGKGLIQQRESLKQNLAATSNELEKCLHELQLKDATLQGALAEIDPAVDSRTNDPLEKMKQIEKVIQDLQAATSSAEQDSRKSKRAAELLLAELNEVQERNEDLLEEISELSRQRDSAEASNRESLTRLEQLSALHSEERSSQFSELTNLKSRLEQLSPAFSKVNNLLDDVLPKDLEYLYNLEAGVKSLLESNDTSNVGAQTLTSSYSGISSKSESKVNALFKSFFDSKTEELHNDNTIDDLWRFVGSHMQDAITKIDSFEEKLQSHSKSLHEEAIHLCETVPTLFKEITSLKHSLESANEEIAQLESTGKQNETENVMLRKYISVLYEACKNSVFEIQKSKGEMVSDDSFVEDGETVSVSEEGVTSIVNRLLSAVKDYHSNQTENVEVKLKEMKATISNLQKELTEKDVQKDRISVELVSQIKRAEAAATGHLQELESSKARINDLKDHCNMLEQRVKELEGQESVLVELHEKVKSLTEASTAKEQENEALLQALDEEEAQMEDLRNKIIELEQLVKQKNLDLETADAARGKALKKLSITVSKFDELHHLSETLVSEVDKLQSQLQERDSEISFLRDEITRITSDSLHALKTDERGLTEIQDVLTWLDSVASGVETRDVNLDDNKNEQVQEQKEILKKQITSIISELNDLRQVAQSKDDQLRQERSKIDELTRSLREKESRLSLHENDGSSAQSASVTSEIVEVEPLLTKWPSQGTSTAPQVRSLRKVNNDQLAISIDDVDSDDRDKLDDDDDDKAHGFKSLTTSKLVPRFTRPVTDFVDGLWVSCDRTLMRQPALRLSLILYWAVMHALLAVFVV